MSSLTTPTTPLLSTALTRLSRTRWEFIESEETSFRHSWKSWRRCSMWTVEETRKCSKYVDDEPISKYPIITNKFKCFLSLRRSKPSLFPSTPPPANSMLNKCMCTVMEKVEIAVWEQDYLHDFLRGQLVLDSVTADLQRYSSSSLATWLLRSARIPPLPTKLSPALSSHHLGRALAGCSSRTWPGAPRLRCQCGCRLDKGTGTQVEAL